MLDCHYGSLINETCICDTSFTFPINFAVVINRTCILPIQQLNAEYIPFIAFFIAITFGHGYLLFKLCTKIMQFNIVPEIFIWLTISILIAIICDCIWSTSMIFIIIDRERSTTHSRYIFWSAHIATMCAIEIGNIGVKRLIIEVCQKNLSRSQFFWVYCITPALGYLLFVPALIASFKNEFTTQFHISLAAAWGVIVVASIITFLVQFRWMIINMADSANVFGTSKREAALRRTSIWLLFVVLSFMFSVVLYLTSFIMGICDIIHSETVFSTATVITLANLGFLCISPV